MNLFFETIGQSVCFLMAVPIGLLLAFSLDGYRTEGIVRAVVDILALVGAGLALLALTVVLRDEKLRMYHVLGMLTGCILYVGGIGRLRHGVRFRMHSIIKRAEKRKQEKSGAVQCHQHAPFLKKKCTKNQKQQESLKDKKK